MARRYSSAMTHPTGERQGGSRITKEKAGLKSYTQEFSRVKNYRTLFLFLPHSVVGLHGYRLDDHRGIPRCRYCYSLVMTRVTLQEVSPKSVATLAPLSRHSRATLAPLSRHSCPPPVPKVLIDLRDLRDPFPLGRSASVSDSPTEERRVRRSVIGATSSDSHEP